eukprot:211232-Rhodomonas_salina.1
MLTDCVCVSRAQAPSFSKWAQYRHAKSRLARIAVRVRRRPDQLRCPPSLPFLARSLPIIPLHFLPIIISVRALTSVRRAQVLDGLRGVVRAVLAPHSAPLQLPDHPASLLARRSQARDAPMARRSLRRAQSGGAVHATGGCLRP